MVEKNTNIKMICLNNANYILWKGKMKTFLYEKKLRSHVFGIKIVNSTSIEEREFKHYHVCIFSDIMNKLILIIILLMR